MDATDGTDTIDAAHALGKESIFPTIVFSLHELSIV
jgi:hypothetical protein